MLNNVNTFLEYWEPLWLFLVLTFEALMGVGTFVYVVKEYYYDAAKDKQPKRTRKKGAVKVVVDKDGQAIVTNQPKGVDVEITQKGED